MRREKRERRQRNNKKYETTNEEERMFVKECKGQRPYRGGNREKRPCDVHLHQHYRMCPFVRVKKSESRKPQAGKKGMKSLHRLEASPGREEEEFPPGRMELERAR